MSASAKPRLAGRQPSLRGGVPRVKTWPSGDRRRGKRGARAVPTFRDLPAAQDPDPVPP